MEIPFPRDMLLCLKCGQSPGKRPYSAGPRLFLAGSLAWGGCKTLKALPLAVFGYLSWAVFRPRCHMDHRRPATMVIRH
jgi:hypothetical protein